MTVRVQDPSEREDIRSICVSNKDAPAHEPPPMLHIYDVPCTPLWGKPRALGAAILERTVPNGCKLPRERLFDHLELPLHCCARRRRTRRADTDTESCARWLHIPPQSYGFSLIGLAPISFHPIFRSLLAHRDVNTTPQLCRLGLFALHPAQCRPINRSASAMNVTVMSLRCRTRHAKQRSDST
jgi:hypothetical protein